MKNEIEKIIRESVDIHDEDIKSGYIIGAFYIKELTENISNFLLSQERNFSNERTYFQGKVKKRR